jgi:predicted RNA methylase
MQHHVFALTFDGALHICPAGRDGKPLKRVLDAGTGTGIWAMDFGTVPAEPLVLCITG